MIDAGWEQDVLQVCRNGHVLTDRLRTVAVGAPSHCDRCGADTLSSCPTCGRPLPGALLVPGLVPVGAGRAPAYCSSCGARFPWTKSPERNHDDDVAWLELLLRRLPRVIQQMRSRHGTRPPFSVEDQYDLEDMVRALLPLHFDSLHLHSHTPRHAPGAHTDLFLPGPKIALTIKLVRPPVALPTLASQIQEDRARWPREDCRLLVAFLHDPEAVLREPSVLEAAWSQGDEQPPLRCIIASP